MKHGNNDKWKNNEKWKWHMVQQQTHGEMTIKIEIPYETVRKHMVLQGGLVRPKFSSVLSSENSPKFLNCLRTTQIFHLKCKKKIVKQLMCDVERLYQAPFSKQRHDIIFLAGFLEF